MGQPVTVVERHASQRGVVRFEANRSITGMGHLHYASAVDATDDTPPDRLARLLFERGGIDGIHINSNIITIDLAKGADAEGIREMIEAMFLHYRQ